MPTRILVACLLICGTLAADALLLKNGTVVGGKISTKPTHYEVTAEEGLRTYLKEEVDKVITDPRHFLGDADQSIEEAKAAFKELESNPAGGNAKVRNAVAKLTQARAAYATAREYFPDDKWADLDKQLMQIMMLMRLLRDRMGSEIAKGGIAAGAPRAEGVKAPPPAPAPAYVPARVDDAIAIIVDAAKRGDPAQRTSARALFTEQRRLAPAIYDLATAAALYLSKSDADWKLTGSTQKAFEEYITRGWLMDLKDIKPEANLNAAKFLAEKAAAIRKAEPAAGVDPLILFAYGHLAHSVPGADRDGAARTLGLVSAGGIVGTPEGHAIRDMNGFIEANAFDLAVLAFTKEHRATDTAAVRFVWSWALFQLVIEKKRQWTRPVDALATVKSPDKVFEEHAFALMKSIKNASPCAGCNGEGKLRCTRCHGKGDQKVICKKCDGTGTSAVDLFGDVVYCTPCKRTGYSALIKCGGCTTGFFDCRKCEKPGAVPALEDICIIADCAACEGRGLAFRGIVVVCRSCMGIGKRITPKWDRSKVLAQ